MFKSSEDIQMKKLRKRKSNGLEVPLSLMVSEMEHHFTVTSKNDISFLILGGNHGILHSHNILRRMKACTSLELTPKVSLNNIFNIFRIFQ